VSGYCLVITSKNIWDGYRMQKQEMRKNCVKSKLKLSAALGMRHCSIPKNFS
jgi:hypothetical protein